MHRILAALALALSATLAFAGSYCVIDPPRPGASTGFYVAKQSTQRAVSSADTAYRLYTPAGDEFRPHGVNNNHWDAWGAAAGIPLSGANMERVFLRFTDPVSTTWPIVSGIRASGIVPIPTNWTTTCKSDQASLAAAVDTWVAQAPTWTQLNDSGLINIANEWGPADSGWLTGYTTAVQRMRAAGYTGALLVDAGGCGQDARTLVSYGSQLLDADPLHNLVFGVHIYGVWHVVTSTTPYQSWWGFTYDSMMTQLRATGLPVIVSEFGPYNGGNSSSKTLVPPDKLIADAEANGWGWLAWSWDDNNLAGCKSDDNGFSMTTLCGVYTGKDDTELTAWGRTIVQALKARR